MAMDAQSPTSRPKQSDLMFDDAMARYPTPPSSGGHHQSQHPHAHNQFFDLTSPIPSPPSADPVSASQACASSRQYQQHHQSSVPNFYTPSHLPRPPYGHHQHHQHYSTVHPTEISPLDICPSNSVYSEMAHTAAAGMGCDPGGYLCASDMTSTEDLKETLVTGIGMGMSVAPSAVQDNWNNERKQHIDGGDFGDLDAEGEEVDPSDVEQSFGGGGPLVGSPLLTAVNPDGGDNETQLDDTDESKISEDSSSTDSDGSEFMPGSRPQRRHRQRTTQTTMSLSYPSYGYAGSRSPRTRSGTRYTPYPNDYSTENNPSYVGGDSSQGGVRSKRYSIPDNLSDGPTEFSDGYMNITTLTTASVTASRRRPRPTNSLPVPIPIPHLTKKSRGRRVPTVSSLEDLRSASSGAGRKRQTAGRGARMYLCEVEGCGKCFARGEHLKRHVRSIHTYEKRELLFLLLFFWGVCVDTSF